jgi:hypothetical protein
MADSALKSAMITNLDANPVVRGTNGQNAAGTIQVVTGGVTALDADSTSSTYKLVRFPSMAVIKYVGIMSRIATAGSGDINIAYSDSLTDGTQPGLRGTIPQLSAANNKLFGAAQSLVLAGVMTEKTFANTYLTNARYEQPIWQVLGLTADPGGFFDIQINITTQVTTGGQVVCKVEYVTP